METKSSSHRAGYTGTPLLYRYQRQIRFRCRPVVITSFTLSINTSAWLSAVMAALGRITRVRLNI
ncbi:hypothetical protein KCP75_00965 [Salmonella enterica subsp. enterica]|nr:hypothetical protein KCP75_00965 [Salmonella enterica subsp. enterica]